MWFSLLYEAGVPLALGAWLLAYGNKRWRNEQTVDAPRIWRYIRPGTLGGLLVLASALAAIRVIATETSSAVDDQLMAARGQVVDGTYKNSYFNFQLDLGEQWKVQPREVLGEAVKDSPNQAGVGGVELTLLGFPQGSEAQPVANVVIGIELLPRSTNIDDSREYLDAGMQRIRAGTDPPLAIEILPERQISGNRFSAARVTREANDVTYYMVFMATKKNDRVMFLSGTFGDAVGESLVSELLGGLK